jgi:hypothetical protein
MLVTLRSAWAAPPVVHDVTWEQVRELFHAQAQLTFQPNVDPKIKPLDLPLICFAAFKGSYKRTDLRSGLSAIALDYDDTPQEDFASVLERARRGATHGIAHTTWKHGEDGRPTGTVRARIVLELAGEIDLVTWHTLWPMVALDCYAARGLDTQCKNPERCYYLPACNPRAAWPCWIESW